MRHALLLRDGADVLQQVGSLAHLGCGCCSSRSPTVAAVALYATMAIGFDFHPCSTACHDRRIVERRAPGVCQGTLPSRATDSTWNKSASAAKLWRLLIAMPLVVGPAAQGGLAFRGRVKKTEPRVPVIHGATF